MPIKLLSPVNRGLTLVFPPPLLALAEAEEELPVLVALPLAPEVMLPLGMPVGRPELTPTSPTVGNAMLGFKVQAFDPLKVADGQGGGLIEDAEAEYADKATPLGDKVAHAAWRLEKSGETGVGVPCRVYLRGQSKPFVAKSYDAGRIP